MNLVGGWASLSLNDVGQFLGLILSVVLVFRYFHGNMFQNTKTISDGYMHNAT